MSAVLFVRVLSPVKYIVKNDMEIKKELASICLDIRISRVALTTHRSYI